MYYFKTPMIMLYFPQYCVSYSNMLLTLTQHVHDIIKLKSLSSIRDISSILQIMSKSIIHSTRLCIMQVIICIFYVENLSNYI